MGRISKKQEIKDRYLTVLKSGHPYQEAIKITAELFAIDNETVIANLEDMQVIPKARYEVPEIINSNMDIISSGVDAYYLSLIRKKEQTEKQIESLKDEVEGIDTKLKEIEELARGLDSEIKKTNKGRKRKNSEAGT
jgi:hypothetical protein